MFVALLPIFGATQIQGDLNSNAVFGNGVTVRDVPSIAENYTQMSCNTTSATRTGGTLYVTSHSNPSKWTQIVDLGDAVWRGYGETFHKPHMVIPSPNDKYVAITNTASNSVLIMDASTHTTLDYVKVPTSGSSIHSAMWKLFSDGTLALILVDMTGKLQTAAGGGGLHMYHVSNEGKAIAVTTLSIPVAFSLPSTSTKPIDAGSPSVGNHIIITDAKSGGLFIVQMTQTSLTPVTRVPPSDLGNCATGGGLWVKSIPNRPHHTIAVFGKQAHNMSCLIEFDTYNERLERVINLPYASIDAHGLDYCSAPDGALYVIVSSRVSATVDVINYTTGSVIASHDLNAVLTPASSTCGDTGKFIMPDVLRIVDKRVYQTTRGPIPISAVSMDNAFPNASPGLYTYTLSETCDTIHRTATDVAIASVTDWTVAAASDPHGGDVVGSEYWLIDQSPSGAVMDCNGQSTYVSKLTMVQNDVSAYDTPFSCDSNNGGGTNDGM